MLYSTSRPSNFLTSTAPSPPMRTESRYTSAINVGCSHTHPTAASPHTACYVDQRTTKQMSTQTTCPSNVSTVKATMQAPIKNAIPDASDWASNPYHTRMKLHIKRTSLAPRKINPQEQVRRGKRRAREKRVNTCVTMTLSLRILDS